MDDHNPYNHINNKWFPNTWGNACCVAIVIVSANKRTIHIYREQANS